MPCYHPIRLNKSTDRGMPLVVPCSRCIGCRLERSRQWAVRCINEAQMHKDNAFVTLTYRDEELIYGKDRATLYPRHLQLFMKRLRKRFGDGIRFFACGEYGDSSFRPHYHACLFGVQFPDKKLWSIQDDNYLYSSVCLDSIWTHGHTLIGDVTFESAAYVARYIMGKKLGGTAGYYSEQGIEPEFVRMSRRPGLGASWFDKYKTDVFPHDFQIIRGGIKSRPPRYYSNIFEVENPDKMKYIKIRRRNESFDRRADNTVERLLVKEVIKTRQVESLIRKSI